MRWWPLGLCQTELTRTRAQQLSSLLPFSLGIPTWFLGLGPLAFPPLEGLVAGDANLSQHSLVLGKGSPAGNLAGAASLLSTWPVVAFGWTCWLFCAKTVVLPAFLDSPDSQTARPDQTSLPQPHTENPPHAELRLVNTALAPWGKQGLA